MTMGHPAPHRPATYDDILALPEGVVGEIIEGELHVNPRPAPPHVWSGTRLVTLLDGPFGIGLGGPGGWIILAEPEIQFGASTLVPDLAAWRSERLPVLPRVGPLRITPDWICEVLSPGTERTDRLHKLRIYAAHRVGHVWLVNPTLRTLEIFQLQTGSYLLLNVFAGDDLIRAEPFDAVELPLQHVWGPTDDGGTPGDTA